MVHGFHYEREAVGPVVAPPGQQPNAHGIAPGHEPVAVVLDFVNPVQPAGGLSAGDGRLGSMKPAGGFGRTRYSMGSILNWAQDAVASP